MFIIVANFYAVLAFILYSLLRKGLRVLGKRSLFVVTWLLLFLRLLLPFSFTQNISRVLMFRKSIPVINPSRFPPINSTILKISLLLQQFKTIYLIGMMIWAVVYIYRFLLTIRFVKNQEANSYVDQRFSRDKITVYRSKNLDYPFSFSLLNSSIFIPEEYKKNLPLERYVLLHEIEHVAHRDSYILIVLSILKTLYWINPVIYLFCKNISNDLEILCDQAVLRKIGREKTEEYARSLVSVAMGDSASNTELCNSYANKFLKERIMNMKEKKRTRALYGLVILGLVFLLGFIFATEVLGYASVKISVEEPGESWSTNQNGESVGVSLTDGGALEAKMPDLVYARGIDGNYGYIRLKEKMQNSDANEDSSCGWSLYAEDGVTVIGSFMPQEPENIQMND